MRAVELREPVSGNVPSVPVEESEFQDAATPADIEISETREVVETYVETASVFEDPLPRTPQKPVLPPAPTLQVPAAPRVVLPPPKSALFDATEKISGDSMLKIRDDIGDCTRCKLHKARNKIVFADGDPKAKLVFVGEGPGRDEDTQGLPFVGRAGKLLTQMIEAMGLRRQDVYICNVVKCRPPENRLPEPDEIKTCSPFLMRQLEVVDPKVIVALGALRGADAAANDARHFAFSWAVAGISRPKIDGDVSPGVFAAQSAGEGRRLERFADGHGRAWLEAWSEVDFGRTDLVARLDHLFGGRDRLRSFAALRAAQDDNAFSSGTHDKCCGSGADYKRQ